MPPLLLPASVSFSRVHPRVEAQLCFLTAIKIITDVCNSESVLEKSFMWIWDKMLEEKTKAREQRGEGGAVTKRKGQRKQGKEKGRKGLRIGHDSKDRSRRVCRIKDGKVFGKHSARFGLEANQSLMQCNAQLDMLVLSFLKLSYSYHITKYLQILAVCTDAAGQKFGSSLVSVTFSSSTGTCRGSFSCSSCVCPLTHICLWRDTVPSLSNDSIEQTHMRSMITVITRDRARQPHCGKTSTLLFDATRPNILQGARSRLSL
ncbi:uncharacterized protein V6R79_013013 [Siganus canaliculatus]